MRLLNIMSDITIDNIDYQYIYDKDLNNHDIEKGIDNSDLTLIQESNSDSIIDNDSEFFISDEIISKDIDNIEIYLSHTKYEKVKFEDVKNDIKKNYEKDLVTITSNHLDIIASYLSCQKIIYMEASHYVSLRLNFLMIPTILI